MSSLKIKHYLKKKKKIQTIKIKRTHLLRSNMGKMSTLFWKSLFITWNWLKHCKGVNSSRMSRVYMRLVCHRCGFLLCNLARLWILMINYECQQYCSSITAWITFFFSKFTVPFSNPLALGCQKSLGKLHWHLFCEYARALATCKKCYILHITHVTAFRLCAIKGTMIEQKQRGFQSLSQILWCPCTYQRRRKSTGWQTESTWDVV